MRLVQGLCQNLKQLKNGKKNGTRYSSQRKKTFFVSSAGKTEKMPGFTEAFIQDSDNFKTSALSDHDKSKMQVINKGKYVESAKREEHYHPTL